MCFLIMLSIFAVAVNANGDPEQDPPYTEDQFPFEGEAVLYLYGAEGVTVEGTKTYNYPPLNPNIPRPSLESFTAQPSFASEEVPAWDIRVTGDFVRTILGLKWTTWTDVAPTMMYQIDIILGDVNYDGTVNCKDLRIILRAFGSSPDNRRQSVRDRWNPDCDLNEDGRINFRDLCIAFRNFGEKAQWVEVPEVRVIGDMIYGEPEHFSIFRGR